MKKTLIIIPTYNEIENIHIIIDRVFTVLPEANILVVDDNSPDGTGKIVEDMMISDDRINCLHRTGKQGLGTAYVAGFKYALEMTYDFIFEMDADQSHDPKELPHFLKALENYDLVLGSRYITGVNVVNWPLARLLLSYFGNVYVRKVVGMPVRDATGGYKGFRREVLEAINLDKVSASGYSFQVEMTFIAYCKKFRIKEIPIIFVDRLLGESKMSTKIIREGLLMVWRLRIKKMFGMIK
jgi:dolichol-phosphate mannosyltransferase